MVVRSEVLGISECIKQHKISTMATDIILFSERQYFRQWWLWGLLLMPFGLILYGLYVQLVQGIPFGNNPGSNEMLIGVAVFLLLLLVAFYFMSLQVELSRAGIRYRFFPFFGSRFIAWEEVAEAEVRQYQPLKEYGGWGIKYGSGGTAYNVSGNMGLQLVLHKNNKRILLGTQQPEALRLALQKMRPH
jgi:hypothetical protein